jgi:hypothetical protein
MGGFEMIEQLYFIYGIMATFLAFDFSMALTILSIFLHGDWK